jgi:signal transduction histidine kinase
MAKLDVMTSMITSRKIPISTGAAIIFLVIIDLLMTRQILAYNNDTETIMFVLTVVIGYGLGSWILLGYVKQVSKEIRAKSRFMNLIHWAVTIIQFCFLGMLLFMLFSNTTGFFSPLVFATSSIFATVIMGITTFTFFSWYKLSKHKNMTILLYGIAALTLALSIAEDAGTKLSMVKIVQEKSPVGATTQSSFLYKPSQKYNAEIEYKVVNPHTTTLYILPISNLTYYNLLNSTVIPIGFVFRWIASTMLLRDFYKRIGKVPISFWIILSLPLIFYLVGKMPGFFSGESLSGVEEPYRYYFRILFRAGTIAGNILFGLPFFMAARSMISSQVKDYLTISAIGFVLIGVSLSTSALQQTYGMAAHSLVLLSSYLFTIGLYSSVISVSQDSSLREVIRKSSRDVSKLLDVLGTPDMKQEIQTRVLNVAREQQEILTQKTGVHSSLTEHDMKQYLGSVLKEIKVLQDVDEILKKGRDILEKSIEFVICSKIGSLRLVYNNYFGLYEKVMIKYKNKEHKGIMLVTSVDKDSIELVRKFLDIGVQIRHVNDMPPIDFAASDKEMIATIQKTEGGYEIQNLLVSNESAYMKHFVSIFEQLWNSGVNAKERIKVIEQGFEPEFFEVITDRQKASQILVELAKSIRREALLLLPNDVAMIRMDRLGILDYLIKSSQQNGARIQIICPLSPKNSEIIKQMSVNASNIKILNGKNSSSGMFIVDSTKFLRAELQEPNAHEFSQAIGFSIYSNSRQSVDSFKSIFELLWDQTELAEQLKMHDKMQQEFINIAAHELRTPIQPILALTEVVRSKIKDTELGELLDVVNRNAKRLLRLTEELLDITRIESQSLRLKKERLKLNEIIENVVTDSQNHILNEQNHKMKLEFTSNKEDVFVQADKQRIVQVISNLLDNAIKFIDWEQEGDIIQIKTEKKKYVDGAIGCGGSSDYTHVIISVRDSGKGIDPEIMPRLFTKFTTKSLHGTGLGLYISKNIVEAHSGRIWAENNKDNRGATFYFSLPLSNRDT